MHGRIIFLGIKTHSCQWLERIVGEDIDPTVVRLEVVYLLAEQEGPEVLAEELDYIQGGGRAWRIA